MAKLFGCINLFCTLQLPIPYYVSCIYPIWNIVLAVTFDMDYEQNMSFPLIKSLQKFKNKVEKSDQAPLKCMIHTVQFDKFCW